MIKKAALMAIPLACATVCGTSFAQSSVTIYGIIDAGITYINNVGVQTGTTAAGAPIYGANKSKVRLDDGAVQPSRFGFRGREDLGGGLNAIFTMESGFNVDNGTQTGTNSQFFNRQAFVGLTSRDWGQLSMGRQYSPMYNDLILTSFAPRFGSAAGAIDCVPGDPRLASPGRTGAAPTLSPAPLPGVATTACDSTAADRIDNSVYYASPSFGGFTVKGMYGFGEAAGNNGAGRFLGISGKYSFNGMPPPSQPWDLYKYSYLSLSYDQLGGTGALAPSTGAPKKTKVIFGGNYDFGMFSVTGKMSRIRNADFIRNDNGVGNSNIYSLFVSVPVNRWEVYAGYSHLNDKSPLKNNIDLYAAGAIYWVSARTSLYGLLTHEKVKGVNGIAGMFFDTSATDTQSQFSFGMRHTF